MQIDTTRFGELDIAESRIIRFEKGLLGFPKYQRYVLIESGDTLRPQRAEHVLVAPVG